MKSVEFCYWLQGYFELSPGLKELTVEQVECIKKHLNLVFYHEIDPSYSNAEELSKIHAKPNLADPFEIPKVESGSFVTVPSGLNKTLIRC